MMVVSMKHSDKVQMAGVLTCLALVGCSSDVAESSASEPESTAVAPVESSAADTAAAPASAAAEPSAAPAAAQPSMPAPAAQAAPAAPQPPAAMPAATTPAPGSSMLPQTDPRTPFKDLPSACQGLPVLGMKNSPGGSVLPNKCAPFDGTRNNPYAIRCIDADPSYKTGYPGDEYCILPPSAELGTQIHVGPADNAHPGTFALVAGDEQNTLYYINSINTEDHYYYRTNWRMRPGSHHMIITVSDTDRADGWASDLGASGFGFGFDFGAGTRSFGGSQRVDQDRPQGTLDVPPENVGLGAQLKAQQQFAFNLHHINTTDSPVLREVWVNVWYVAETDVTQKMQGLSASGSPFDVSIPAHQRSVLTYRCDVQNDSRIITMNGHRHAHTDRFGVWVKKTSGETISAYESFNWEDMPTYQYDSISTNPAPNLPSKVDGASSGELNLTAGDQLWFTCDINNTLDVPLKFANEAIDGEMCILFGSYVGTASPCSGGAARVRDAAQ
jgi:hypothetical protein